MLKFPIYLDYAATTPLDPRVLEAMQQVLAAPDLYGNAASPHYFGWKAQELIETARQQVAECINAQSNDIIWTSGATESNNLALKGAANFYRERGRHIITLQTEHKSVLDTCAQLEREGFSVTYLRPQKNGLLDLTALQNALRAETILVSIMQVNNEIGVVQNLADIAAVIKPHDILFHVDAAQSIGKISLNLQKIPADFVSLSAHKAYGPKGIGALYIRQNPRARVVPLLHGGGHEQGLRSGTLPTHQIVGMGMAFKLAQQQLAQDEKQVRALHQQLIKGLLTIPGVILNSAPAHCVPGIVNISCQAVEGESLLLALEPEVAVSSGSACTTTTIEVSHVLTGLGISAELAHSAIRISFGRFTTAVEIAKTIEVLGRELTRLRSLSSAWSA